MSIFFRNKPAYTQKDVVYQFAKLFSVHFTGFNYKVRVTEENVASSFKVVFLIPDWIRTFDHIWFCEVFSRLFFLSVPKEFLVFGVLFVKLGVVGS